MDQKLFEILLYQSEGPDLDIFNYEETKNRLPFSFVFFVSS